MDRAGSSACCSWLGMAAGVKPGGGTRPHPHPLGLKPPVTRTHHPWRVSLFPTPATRMGNGSPSGNPHPPAHVAVTPNPPCCAASRLRATPPPLHNPAATSSFRNPAALPSPATATSSLLRWPGRGSRLRQPCSFTRGHLLRRRLWVAAGWWKGAVQSDWGSEVVSQRLGQGTPRCADASCCGDGERLLQWGGGRVAEGDRGGVAASQR
jgi:hypothetical protein